MQPQAERTWSQTRRASGFTLIELMVIIAVIGLLMAIILPAFQKARESARRAVCVSHLKQIGVAVFSYAGVNEDSAPPVMDPLGKYAPRSLMSTPRGLVNLGLLMREELETSDVFICPSQEVFCYDTNMEDLGEAAVGGSYVYAVHLPASTTAKVGAVRQLALISDDFLKREDQRYGNGWFTHRDGYNVLYTDGSASWYSNPSQSIAEHGAYWDDETDDFNYHSYYQYGAAPPDPDEYGSDADIFRIWHAFCYSLPDPFEGHDDED